MKVTQLQFYLVSFIYSIFMSLSIVKIIHNTDLYINIFSIIYDSVLLLPIIIKYHTQK